VSNAIQILAAQQTGKVTRLDHVYVNGQAVPGTFAGNGTWTVRGVDLSHGAVITGRLTTSGWANGNPNERNKIEITIGCRPSS
jgi:hypothetical protein